MDTKSLYDKWVEIKPVENGIEIKCKKGNWSVVAPTKHAAQIEARSYFLKYLQKGEYT